MAAQDAILVTWAGWPVCRSHAWCPRCSSASGPACASNPLLSEPCAVRQAVGLPRECEGRAGSWQGQHCWPLEQVQALEARPATEKPVGDTGLKESRTCDVAVQRARWAGPSSPVTTIPKTRRCERRALRVCAQSRSAPIPVTSAGARSSGLPGRAAQDGGFAGPRVSFATEFWK